MKNKVHFSSQRLNWKTPKAVYQTLDAEFGFDCDPCPPNYKADGLYIEWGGGEIMLIRHMVEKSVNGLQKGMRNFKKAKQLCFWFRVERIQSGGMITA